MAKLTLNPNERVIMDGSANKWQGSISQGGKLYLTNQRLAFVAHMFNFGTKFHEIPLGDIATAGNTFKFKTTTNLVSFNIFLETKSGDEIGFVVTRRQKNNWIENIGKAICEYAAEHIEMPQMPIEARAQALSQMKVISCTGCGAFVLVMGPLAKCEYCDRPTVG